jgi:hypothetical protein
MGNYPDLELSPPDTGSGIKGTTTFIAHGARIICPDCRKTRVFSPRDGLDCTAGASGKRQTVTCGGCKNRRSYSKWALA